MTKTQKENLTVLQKSQLCLEHAERLVEEHLKRSGIDHCTRQTVRAVGGPYTHPDPPSYTYLFTIKFERDTLLPVALLTRYGELEFLIGDRRTLPLSLSW